MFKTVRAQHGAGDLAAELEYTILPQSDDRSPSASSSEDEPTCRQHCGHHQCRCQYHQHRRRCQHHRGSSSSGGGPGTRRTIIVILIMLVLGCGVVAAAVLVPILLAARLVSVPTSARLQTFAVAASGVIHSARGDYMPLLPIKTASPGIVINFRQDRPPTSQPTSQPPPPSSIRRRRRRAADGPRLFVVGRRTTRPHRHRRRPDGSDAHRRRKSRTEPTATPVQPDRWN